MIIYEKLFKVQQELHAPKDQVNTFGKYNYRSCEQVLEALKPLLKENNMLVTLSDTVKEIGGRVYIEATATAIDAESGESFSVTAYAREEEMKKGMDTSQITGAASSYARKYALSGLFAIDDNKDSDATNDGENNVNKPSTVNEKPKEGKRTTETQKPKQAPNTPLKTGEYYDKAAELTQYDGSRYFVMCADCDERIYDQPKKDGSLYPVQDYVAACLKTYGRPVCKDCRKKHDSGKIA